LNKCASNELLAVIEREGIVLYVKIW
jgi:hypothetical protein